MKDSTPQTISLQEMAAALWRGRLLLVLGPTLGVALALSLSMDSAAALRSCNHGRAP